MTGNATQQQQITVPSGFAITVKPGATLTCQAGSSCTGGAATSLPVTGITGTGTGVIPALQAATNGSGGVPTVPVANGSLANSGMTVNGINCTLGSSCSLPSSPNPQIAILTSGSGTYTTPTGTSRLEITVIGGGAGGIGSGTQTTAPTAGGNTTFCTVSGCGSGTVYNAGGGPLGPAITGGVASGGDINISGQGSLLPTGTGITVNTQGEPGGSSPFGLGLGGLGTSGGIGNAGTGYGAGGAGGGGNASCPGQYGGTGGGGLTKMIISPAASYFYTIGPAGVGAVASICFSGGAGTGGILIIKAYF